VPTLETPMSPGGSQASAGEGLSPCNIGIGIGSRCSQWRLCVFVSAGTRTECIAVHVKACNTSIRYCLLVALTGALQPKGLGLGFRVRLLLDMLPQKATVATHQAGA